MILDLKLFEDCLKTLWENTTLVVPNLVSGQERKGSILMLGETWHDDSWECTLLVMCFPLRVFLAADKEIVDVPKSKPGKRA